MFDLDVAKLLYASLQIFLPLSCFDQIVEFASVLLSMSSRTNHSVNHSQQTHIQASVKRITCVTPNTVLSTKLAPHLFRLQWKEWLLRLTDFPDLMFDPVKFPETVDVNNRDDVDPVHNHEADIKDGGASNIKELLKHLDKSHSDHLQWETVSQLGDTSSAVRFIHRVTSSAFLG